ncbi:hypothetical protein MMC24_003532 [Lignoscripta atroalba]|nr:hypothetical protein [Lignoscripta atroalba]
MARGSSVSQSAYGVITVLPSESEPARCTLRSDDTGFWNAVNAWWLFPLHLTLCGLVVVIILLWLDEHTFHTGAPTAFLTVDSGLYQTQVNALLSLALVSIRLLGGSCTALLVWRIIFIMLEKRGISLLEITRLSSWRVPVAPVGKSRRQVLWSIWATLTIILLWPPSFSAPLASSAVAWVPSTRLTQDVSQIAVTGIDQSANYGRLGRDDFRYVLIVNAAAKTAADSSYVTEAARGVRTRRFFGHSLPIDSVMNITAPYFDVNLKWIDASSVDQAGRIGASTYSDVNANGFLSDNYGTVAILRDKEADGSVEQPKVASTFTGKKYVWVSLGGINPSSRMEDGSMANEETPCPTKSPYFGILPEVEQYRSLWSSTGPNGTWTSTNCFLVAEASISAGKQWATDCKVAAFDGSEQYATCTLKMDRIVLQKDWLTDIALAFTSEVLKFTIIQNLTLPFMSNTSIDKYTASTLALGYHASWNALMKLLGNVTEPSTFRSAESVVQAQISRPKLFGWLAMNATLAVSALLVYIAVTITATKPICDTALAAMTMDLTEIMHSDSRADGLCNAVTLSKTDKKLPRMMWERSNNGDWRAAEAERHSCYRRLVFRHEIDTRPHGSALLTRQETYKDGVTISAIGI